MQNNDATVSSDQTRNTDFGKGISKRTTGKMQVSPVALRGARLTSASVALRDRFNG